MVLFADKVFSCRVSHCRHASIRTLKERIVSLGARWAFSIQPALLSVWRPVVSLPSGTWPRPLTRSPELGFGFCLSSSWNDFDFGFAILFYAAAATVVRLRLCNGSYTSPLTHRWCSNTASFLAVATIARFFPFLPPRSASFSPQRLRSQSMPNGPRMCCAPCTSSVRR